MAWSGGYRNSYTKVPVDNSFVGVRMALEEESQQLSPIQMRVEVAVARAESFLLRLTRDSRPRLRRIFEGYAIAGKREGDSAYPWIGEVTELDAESNALIVEKRSGRAAPKSGEIIYAYPPDFQVSLREWADENEKQGRAPSAFYEGMIFQEFVGKAPTLDFQSYLSGMTKLRDFQKKAVVCTGRPLSLVWGPPGTGKTFTLGYAAAAFLRSNTSLMITAPTNSAVDQALVSIDEACKSTGRPLKDGDLIRLGVHQLKELESRPHLIAWQQNLSQGKREMENLAMQIKGLDRKIPGATAAIRAKIVSEKAHLSRMMADVESKKNGRRDSLLRSSRIIAATTAGLLYHPEIIEHVTSQKTALFIDEASMIPRVMLLRLLSEDFTHLAVFGDPKQLGPIRRSQNPNDHNAKYWISTGVFDCLGAVRNADLNELERKGSLVMLQEQSRMHKDICDSVSKMFYDGRLRTVDGPPDPPIAPGWPEHSIAVVDPLLQELPPVSPKAKVSKNTISNKNEHSAWIAIGIAFEYLKQKPKASVLIAAPFKSQAILLKTLVDANLSSFPNVAAGTIHVTQGKEADLVIFDPVKPDHRWLTGDWDRTDMERLLCVVFSRARRQLIVLAESSKLLKNKAMMQLTENAVDWSPTWTKAKR